MNTKRKGSRNERRSIALLESAGYACTRAAASLGVFDIVGVPPSDVVLVQVKSRDWPGSTEMETIRNFPCPHCARKSFTATATGYGYPMSARCESQAQC